MPGAASRAVADCRLGTGALDARFLIYIVAFFVVWFVWKSEWSSALLCGCADGSSGDDEFARALARVPEDGLAWLLQPRRDVPIFHREPVNNLRAQSLRP